MSYTLTFPVILSSSSTGLTLSAQLIDTAGVDVGSPITGAVVEIGAGQYLFSSSAIPDGHRGGVKFFSGVTFKAFAAIAPEDVENLDTKISTRPTAAAIDSQLSGTHGSGAWDGGGTDPLENTIADYSPGELGYILGTLSGAESVTSSAPVVTTSGDIELVKGQDYRQENSNEITFSNTGTWPALGNATIWMEVPFADEPLDMDIVQLGATQIVRLNLDDQTTADLPLNRYQYAVFAQLSGGNTFVLAKGRLLFT